MLNEEQIRPYKGEPYTAIIPPQADTYRLSKKGERVFLYHLRYGSNLSVASLRIAPKGMLCAGFVIGIIA